ncbi:MAG: ATP-binding protein [Euryarchaeota archaeon]|nr:ATP-binding protein [Euryarchaeota archaeon]
MGSRDLSLYIGPTGMGSQIEAAVESTQLVVEETTAAGVGSLDDETSPDCIVTDHDPPDRDCFELLEAVPPEIPVVLAPSGGSSSLATRGLRAGAETYLDPTTCEDGAAAIAAEIDRITAERYRNDDRIERFTSLVSHELRSPIQTAKSGLDLARTECDSHYLDNVAETIDQLDQLIDNLVDELKHDEIAVEMDAVDLAAVVEETWADRTGATLSVESELPTIEAERSRLRQLLDNVFRNSVKHGGDGTTVRIGVIESQDGSDDTVGLYIADNGPGIEPDRREDIFDYGYTGSANGTGFGLAIVSEIVEAFDWEISVTESGDGGARFELHNVKEF